MGLKQDEMRQVMVVEGDQVLMDMMVELLGREGCAVTAVESVGEAVSRASGMDRDVDMLIFDADTVKLNLPDDTLAKWQTWLHGCVRPPTWVVVSVSASRARYPSLLLMGPGRYPMGEESAIWLRKPFRNEEFLAVVRHMPGGTPEAQESPSDRSLVTLQRRQT